MMAMTGTVLEDEGLIVDSPIDIEPGDDLYWMEVEDQAVEEALALAESPTVSDPDAFLLNVYCPNGPGGGVDPSCTADGLPGGAVLEKIKLLGGSTGAYQAKSTVTGKFYAVKGGNSVGHIESEAMVNDAYRAAGVLVPKSHYDEGSKQQIAEWVDGVELKDIVGPVMREDAYDQLRQNFAADALFANWDVVGLNQDNIKVDADGKVWRIDNGGAFKYRAQGSEKIYTDIPHEFDSMRTSIQGKPIFGSLTDAQIAGQVQKLVDKKGAILAAVKDPGVRATLAKRFDAAEARFLKPKLEHSTPAPQPPTEWGKPLTSMDKVTKPVAKKGLGPHGATSGVATGSGLVSAVHLISGASIIEHIKNIGPFKQLQLNKIEHMNPHGIKNGVLKVPVGVIKGSKDSEARLEALMKSLPAGTKIIGTVGTAAKKIAADVKAGKTLSTPLASKIGKFMSSEGEIAAIVKASKTASAGPKHGPQKSIIAGGGVKTTTTHYDIPAPPTFYASAFSAANSKTAADMHSAAKAGDTEAVKAHPVPAGAAKLQQYKDSVLQTLQNPKTVTTTDYEAFTTAKQGHPAVVALKANPMQKAYRDLHEGTPGHKAIYHYTGSGSGGVNAKMRSCPPDFDCVEGSDRAKMNNLLKTIANAPKFDEPHLTKRGFPLNSTETAAFVAALETMRNNNSTFQWPSITSTSLTKPFPGNMQFQMVTRQGLFVATKEWSSHAGEDEIVVSPKVQWKVLEVTKTKASTSTYQGDNYLVKLVEELEQS